MTVSARYRALFTCVVAALSVVLTPGNAQSPGNTPLILAAWNGDAARVDALLRAGADVNVSNRDGLTALMAATWSGGGTGDVGMARALIQTLATSKDTPR